MMSAVTYSNEEVIAKVEDRFVPLEVNTGQRRDLLRRYNTYWTPTTVLADRRGDPRYRVIGYLPPVDFLAYVSIGEAHALYWDHRYAEAAEAFAAVASSYPGSAPAPEALYMRGVCLRKTMNDERFLEEAAAEITRRYPDSDWARRVEPWL